MKKIRIDRILDQEEFLKIRASLHRNQIEFIESNREMTSEDVDDGFVWFVVEDQDYEKATQLFIKLGIEPAHTIAAERFSFVSWFDNNTTNFPWIGQESCLGRFLFIFLILSMLLFYLVFSL